MADEPMVDRVQPGRSRPQLLIVHDDLQLRLKLATLVRRASGIFDADTRSTSDYESMDIQVLRQYTAAFFIFEFAAEGSSARAMLQLARLRDQVPRLKVFVVARDGSERTAVSCMKMGAADYWAAHCIEVQELAVALRPLADVSSEPVSAPGTKPWGEPQLPGYRLIKKLSHSDSAVVHLAHYVESALPVALKVQMIDHSVPGVVPRFLRECELLSSVNHKAVADVIDFGATADCLYLALEYFPCGSLRDRLKNPLTETEAVEYARQIAGALRVIHDIGIVHRDLKPSNCMLTDKNRLVLIDFGLARAGLTPSDITMPGFRVGTPYYVSPEQMQGALPDARSDLYSLGVVLFEMLNGTLPYRGKSIADVLNAHQNASVPRLPKNVGRYQPVVDRLLAKAPGDRYGSAAQFLVALDEASAPIAAAPAPMAAASAKVIQRSA